MYEKNARSLRATFAYFAAAVNYAREVVAQTHGLPVSQPDTLKGEAVVDLLRMEKGRRDEMGTAARRRVMDRYSLDAMVARYEALYAEVLRP